MRQRQAIIDANPALQERELLKLAALVTALTEALRARGVPEPAASLAARCGVTVFEVAFSRWIADGEDRSLLDLEREMLAELGSFAVEPGTVDKSASDHGR